ncbi:hypothetical protein PG990_001321 [Apiospora arundinis]
MENLVDDHEDWLPGPRADDSAIAGELPLGRDVERGAVTAYIDSATDIDKPPTVSFLLPSFLRPRFWLPVGCGGGIPGITVKITGTALVVVNAVVWTVALPDREIEAEGDAPAAEEMPVVGPVGMIASVFVGAADDEVADDPEVGTMVTVVVDVGVEAMKVVVDAPIQEHALLNRSRELQTAAQYGNPPTSSQLGGAFTALPDVAIAVACGSKTTDVVTVLYYQTRGVIVLAKCRTQSATQPSPQLTPGVMKFSTETQDAAKTPGKSQTRIASAVARCRMLAGGCRSTKTNTLRT